MDINEIRELKRKAEEDIDKILKDLKDKTGCKIQDLTWREVEVTSPFVNKLSPPHLHNYYVSKIILNI